MAYHFHWSPEQIMSLPHRDRQHWVGQIAQINQQINQSNSPSFLENYR